MAIDTAAAPTSDEIDRVVRELEQSWPATITVRRSSTTDMGHREIYISLDGESIGVLRHGDTLSRDVQPGAHRLRAHNTLFWKTIDLTLAPGEQARFVAVNRAGFGTYSVLAFFLGGGPIYLTFERESVNG
jgi:hypothetical protein